MFTAVVLDEQSQVALLDRLGGPPSWESKAHHMTLHMGERRDDDPVEGQRFEMIAYQAAGNGRVTAVKVKTLVKTDNKVPHVTVAVNRDEGGRPVESNGLTNWKNISPIRLFGRVAVCS